MTKTEDSMKTKYCEYKINVGTAQNVQNVKIFVPKFTRGDEFEWLAWAKEYHQMMEQMGWSNNAAAGYRNLRVLFRDQARKNFEAEVGALGAENSENLAEALENMANNYYLTNTTRKDIIDEITKTKKKQDVAVVDHANKLQDLNTLIEYLPEGQNSPVEEQDLLEYFRDSMPRAWIEQYEKSFRECPE